MVQKVKINVKERFTDGEIDLSMSNLEEVPVKEIAALKKTFSLDLSNNIIKILPNTFCTLTFLTKLDLSKNELTELPEDIGNLSKLKYLDLYKNNLERLPLSFGQLTALKFLDLKDNPLVPAIAKVAGPCVDNKGCQQCARDVVRFFKRLQEEVKDEVLARQQAREKQLEINQQKRQEEKRKMKKEKQKANSNLPKPSTTTIRSKKERAFFYDDIRKDNNLPKKPKKSCNSCLISISLILLLGTWFMFAFELPVTRKASSYLGSLINELPSPYKPYGLSLKKWILLSQVATRDFTMLCADYISKSEIYDICSKKIINLIDMIYIKCRDVLY